MADAAFDSTASQPAGGGEGEEDNEDDDVVLLSYVELTDDNNSIRLNGNPNFDVKLPEQIHANKRFSAKCKLVEGAIYEGCNRFTVDTVNSQNASILAREVAGQLHERAKGWQQEQRVEQQQKHLQLQQQEQEQHPKRMK